ncbi:phasin family protein [Acidisphaera rubrifaciens]|uniref:Transcriptional regulator polyhydroxyalkanoate biosynthesis n=1 Tax=Acidisphaera rubrifaciens HS-AP3 TaxID=1231350 RepID=A0A0D6P8Y1_9PROT|nr:phasin family protein [Acidisphaera rubrifaciens]GAN78112.1 transcriptional regulator polyhydroxyalkanoate biosynthesis [Acidisphaera rubrifaciens HS-AP3]
MNAKTKVTEMAATVSEAVSAGAAEGMAATKEGLEKSQVQMKEGMDKVMKGAEDLMAFGQGNVEAFVKSSQIWAAGVQDLSKHVAATAQSTFEETLATFKALTSVRSFKDAFDLQASYARASMEKAMAETGKLTDASFKLAEQAAAPITARVTLAVEKFGKAG